jgi:hypothetical protein
MLPSFYSSGDKVRAWSAGRAAAYGAGLGALAALLKILSPLHQAISVGDTAGTSLVAGIPEVVGAALAFALLCAGASALRNFIARRLIWPEV